MKHLSPRILVVEDDPEILSFLSGILYLHGYKVFSATTFHEACRCIAEEPFLLALLDIRLPGGGSGIDVLKRIRETRGNIPVIMQTALGDDSYCVECLKAGADDFIIKPVRQGPLIARIEAVLRRASGTPDPLAKIHLGNSAYVYSPRREIHFSDGRISRLTHKEMSVLRYLFSRNGEVVTIDDLLLNVWRASPILVDTTCIPPTISRLRKKLENTADIFCVYGNGYVLSVK